jgi:hypothetical protein
LFAAIDAMDREFTLGLPQNRLYPFNVHDVERWLLKVLIGLVQSNAFPRSAQALDTAIPRAWIEVLFGVRPLRERQGLYVSRTIGEELVGSRSVEAAAVFRAGELVGIEVGIIGYRFLLLLRPRATENEQLFGRDFAFRPRELNVTDGFCDKSMVFTSEGAAGGGTIHMRSRHSKPPVPLLFSQFCT